MLKFLKKCKSFIVGVFKFLRMAIVKTGILIIVTSLLILFLLIYNKSVFSTNVLKALYELFLQLCLLGVTIGIGTFIYNCFDVVEFFKKHIKDILIEDGYLKNLSQKKKEELKNKLESDLVYNGYNPQPDCLYSFVKNKIEPLVKNCFFKNYSCEVFCEYIPTEKVIKKHINYNLVVSHIDPNEDVTFDLNSQVRTYFGDEPENSLELEKLIIDNIHYEKDVKIKSNKVPDDGSGYIVECTLEKLPDKLKKVLTFSDTDLAISISLISTVPENDLSYSTRLSFPCSNFDFSFIYDKKQFRADPNVFCFMDTADGPVPRWNLKTTTKMSSVDDIDVNIAGWMLPGDGVAISLDKKKFYKRLIFFGFCGILYRPEGIK